MFRAMMNNGILPREEILFAISDLFSIKVMVHHGMVSPVLYQFDGVTKDSPTIHLQCLNMIHFNPLFSKGNFDKIN